MRNCPHSLIYLIGLPGSGKTTIGRMLARKLHFSFIDTDSAIEQKHCLSVKEIFQQYGESFFRTEEENLLIKEILPTFPKTNGLVVSCGGGLPCHHNLHTFLKSTGKIIHLHPPLSIIVHRLTSSDPTTRPLLGTTLPEITTTLSSLHKIRTPLFQSIADITIQTPSSKEALHEILQQLPMLSSENS